MMGTSTTIVFTLERALGELGVETDPGKSSDVYVVEADDRIFVGGGCESSERPQDAPAIQPRNVSICA